MADNITLNLGSGGDVLAADDIGPGVKYTRSKITIGAAGDNDGDISNSNPMPSKLNPTTSFVASTQVTVNITPEVQLGNNISTRGVVLKSSSGNIGKIFIGLTGVTTSTGFELNAGDSISIPVSNSNLIYATADTDNLILCYMVI